MRIDGIFKIHGVFSVVKPAVAKHARCDDILEFVYELLPLTKYLDLGRKGWREVC